MTRLQEVKRLTCRPPESIRRRLVVMLEPGDTLAMREQGRRRWYRASLEKVYWVLAKWEAAESRKDEGGRRRR
jgi:hypothetical protein